MNILQEVTIEGFWGEQKTVKVKMHPDINFLIGVNGSGKTTAINLIAAALNADFQTLDTLPFDKITIQLAQVNGLKKPSISIIKTKKKHIPFSNIKYLIKEKASAEPIEFSLEDYEEQISFRKHPTIYYGGLMSRTSSDIIQLLQKLVKVSWLSIHRSQIPDRESRGTHLDDRERQPTVDKKLDELSIELSKYFSLLARRTAEETDNFQKNVFLSLIHRINDQSLFSEIHNFNIEEEQKALVQIFEEFNVPVESFSEGVESHFDILRDAIKASTRKTISSEHAVAIIGTWRIHSVVQDWKKLVEKKDRINQPIQTFLDIMNTMIQNKILTINDQNEIEVSNNSGQNFSIKALSSGEKQLLIILGEALLQIKEPCIYIADEPELSLHVKWQEQLITNIRKINPAAQIVFATHSPDIVSVYGNKVYDMEDVLR